jgi:hypothetical protein
MQVELDLFDLELDALVLFLQAQFRLAQVPLGGEVRDLRKAGLEDVEGLGNQARTLIIHRSFRSAWRRGRGRRSSPGAAVLGLTRRVDRQPRPLARHVALVLLGSTA